MNQKKLKVEFENNEELTNDQSQNLNTLNKDSLMEKLAQFIYQIYEKGGSKMDI